MNKAAFFCSLLFISLLSCSESYIYEQSYEPEEEVWRYEQAIEFDFEIVDTSAYYTFFLDIDHSVDYPFQNLYTRIKTSYPNGAEKEDVLSLELSDQLGLWQGNCRKEYCKVRIPLQTEAIIKEAGNYSLRFEQFTRRDTLPGLKKLTLRVAKVAL